MAESLQLTVISFLVLATLGLTENVVFVAAHFYIQYCRWKHWYGTAILLVIK